PSGAGKTSLIQTTLQTRLLSKGYVKLPTVRVNTQPPSGVTSVNRYLYSTLVCLEAFRPEGEQRSLERLAELAPMPETPPAKAQGTLLPSAEARADGPATYPPAQSVLEQALCDAEQAARRAADHDDVPAARGGRSSRRGANGVGRFRPTLLVFDQFEEL